MAVICVWTAESSVGLGWDRLSVIPALLVTLNLALNLSELFLCQVRITSQMYKVWIK